MRRRWRERGNAQTAANARARRRRPVGGCGLNRVGLAGANGPPPPRFRFDDKNVGASRPYGARARNVYFLHGARIVHVRYRGFGSFHPSVLSFVSSSASPLPSPFAPRSRRLDALRYYINRRRRYYYYYYYWCCCCCRCRRRRSFVSARAFVCDNATTTAAGEPDYCTGTSVLVPISVRPVRPCTAAVPRSPHVTARCVPPPAGVARSLRIVPTRGRLTSRLSSYSHATVFPNRKTFRPSAPAPSHP